MTKQEQKRLEEIKADHEKTMKAQDIAVFALYLDNASTYIGDLLSLLSSVTKERDDANGLLKEGMNTKTLPGVIMLTEKIKSHLLSHSLITEDKL